MRDRCSVAGRMTRWDTNSFRLAAHRGHLVHSRAEVARWPENSIELS